MAQIGDVLVKFVADFAEFSKGMQEGQQRLGEFGKQTEEINSKLTSFGNVLRGGAIAGAVLAIGNEIKKLAEQSEKASLEIAKQAQTLGISTDRFQAYQLQAKQTGLSVEEVTKQLKDNGAASDQLIRYYRDLGLIIDSEAIAKFERMNNAAEESQRRINAVIAPLYAAAKETILSAIARELEAIKVAIENIDIGKIASLLALIGTGGIVGPAILGSAGADPVQQQVSKLNDELTKTVQHLNDLRAGTANPMPMISRVQEIEIYEKKLGDLQAQLAKLSPQLPQFPPTVVKPPPDTGAAKGGGGGRTDDDTIEAQIRRYDELAKSAQKAYDTVVKGQNQSIDDLQREVKVQQQIDDIVGKIVAKTGKTPDDPLVQQLRERVTATERWREETQKQIQANVQAQAIEEKLGDGTAAMSRALRDLTRQQATGRLSADAYNRALKQQSETIQQATLEAKRYDDNLGSLAAGFEHAANAFTRQHDLFSVGEQAFTGLTDAMGEGLDVLLGKSDKTFGQIAADFAEMLAKMALQAAASQVFKAIFGTATSSFAGLGVSTLPGDVFGPAPGRQGGGPVSAGQPYVVGEHGAELFVPKAAGSIVPNHQLGGTSVTVNLDMKQAQGAANPTQALLFGRKVREAVVDVIANEKRPGGSLHARTSA